MIDTLLKSSRRILDNGIGTLILKRNTMKYLIMLGVIQVSGYTINISNIYKLAHTLDKGCIVYQHTNPNKIHTKRSCFEIMNDIEWVLNQRKS